MIDDTSGDYVIECQNLVKTFNGHTVLDDLNLKLRRNKITTILGFSGAGKSTLLKHFLGLQHPTSGIVKVLGHDLATLSRYEIREYRRNFGMVFQYAALFDYLNAYDNVAFALREFTSKTESEIKERVSYLFEAVGLEKEAYVKSPSELSGGMRKRVGLARALALDPAIMLYDEPTTGLDPITTKMVNDLIVKTAKEKTKHDMTSVIISHDVKATLQISDYVAFLNRGRIVEYLPAEEFKHSKHPLVQEFINL